MIISYKHLNPQFLVLVFILILWIVRILLVLSLN